VAAHKGKVVLIDFWATWCGPCRAEFPNVKKTYQDYHDKGFDIVGISLDQDKGKLADYMKENGVTWQQYFDGKGWENKLAAKYGIRSIPATILVDADGKILGRDLRGDELPAAIAKAIAGKGGA
jgi:thiol-disulfide isomerase/thioredoxin